MSLNLLHNIQTYYNVLESNESKQIVDISKQYLKKISDKHPALQTPPNFHNVLKQMGMQHLLDKIFKKVGLSDYLIYKSWVVYADEHRNNFAWHTHPAFLKKCLVLYLDNPENIGTLFKVDDKFYLNPAPDNSAILFDPSLLHSPPNNIKMPRYTLSMDLYLDK